MIPNSQALRQVEDRLRAIAKEEEELFRLQRHVGADVERQKQALEEAWTALGVAFIPELRPEVLESCAARLHLRSVSVAAVMAQRQATLNAANAAAAKLREEPGVKNGEAIENEVNIRLAELDEAIAPLSDGTQLLELMPQFSELLAHRYGTDEYQVRFWQSSFYRHWKHADLIVEAHAKRLGVETFAEIAARYVAEMTALTELRRAAAAERTRLSASRDLRAALEKQERIISEIDSITLSLARSAVVEHLRPMSDEDLVALVGSEDGVTSVALKRVLGLKKKQEYLGSLTGEQIGPSLTELRTMKEKLGRTRMKLGRSKNAYRQWNDNDVQRMLGRDRSDRWHKQRTRINESRTRIVEFHHYDRWDPVRDMLWWDVMTDGRLDGNFIPEVRAHGHHHHHHHQHGVVDDGWRESRDIDIS